MSRRFRIAAHAVLAAVLAAGCGTTSVGPRTTSARVEYVQGDVLVDGALVQAGTVLAPVFRVDTGVASTVAIVFDEKNIIEIQEKTEAYIDLTADVRTVELRRGAVASVLRRLTQVTAREPERFRVKTPSAVAGVRGTSFYTRVEDATRSYLCTCNGTVSLSDNQGGNTRVVSASHHEAYHFVQDETGLVTAISAEMLYHDDASMDALAARIGESIDWTRVEAGSARH